MRLRFCLPTLLLSLLAGPAAGEAPDWWTIDRAHAAPHAALLTPGQQALLATLPNTYALRVHPSTDTEAAPAGEPARLGDDGRPTGLGAGIPFPRLEAGDPDGGLKAIWNHRLRARGSSLERATVQAVVRPDVAVEAVELRERIVRPAAGPELLRHLSAIAAPLRLAGSIKLLHEPLDGPTRGWQRSPGPLLSGLKATSDAGGDTPVIGTDGLLDEDQLDGYRGDPSRWHWTLVERSIRVMPWLAEPFGTRDGTPLATLLGPRHPDPTRLHHERRLVLRVDARLQPGEDSAWPRRSYYLDAATWQVLLVELYGRDDRLQRVQEIHVGLVDGRWLPMLTVVHDLPGRRYLVAGIETRADATVAAALPAEALDSGEAARWAKSVGAGPPRD